MKELGELYDHFCAFAIALNLKKLTDFIAHSLLDVTQTYMYFLKNCLLKKLYTYPYIGLDLNIYNNSVGRVCEEE